MLDSDKQELSLFFTWFTFWILKDTWWKRIEGMVKERHENGLTTIITFWASDINKLQCLIGFEVWWLESKSSFFIHKKRPIPTRVPVACTHLQWSGWIIFKRTPNNSILLWWRITVSGIHTLRHNWLAQVWSLLKQYFFKLSNRRTILVGFSAQNVMFILGGSHSLFQPHLTNIDCFHSDTGKVKSLK